MENEIYYMKSWFRNNGVQFRSAFVDNPSKVYNHLLSSNDEESIQNFNNVVYSQLKNELLSTRTLIITAEVMAYYNNQGIKNLKKFYFG